MVGSKMSALRCADTPSQRASVPTEAEKHIQMVGRPADCRTGHIRPVVEMRSAKIDQKYSTSRAIAQTSYVTCGKVVARRRPSSLIIGRTGRSRRPPILLPGRVPFPPTDCRRGSKVCDARLSNAPTATDVASFISGGGGRSLPERSPPSGSKLVNDQAGTFVKIVASRSACAKLGSLDWCAEDVEARRCSNACSA